MAYSALLPFLVLFVSFVFLRLSLTYASFVALLVCTLFSQTLFHATPEMWNGAILRTFEFLVEIGLILLGAFYFIEVAQETKVIESLAKLVREVSPNRIVQGILVAFPLELMVEGSSGFGTPLLIIAPVLLALDFPIILCAILPFINMVNGIPFGALGTPVRLGFPNTLMTHGIATLLLPFAFVGPLLTYALIYRFDQSPKTHFAKHSSLVAWVLLLGGVYTLVNQEVSRMGPEFPALFSGFATFIFGVLTSRFWFQHEIKTKIQNKMGIFVYSLLLLFLFLGKRIWMDQTFTGSHIRLFNPGWIFILFGLGMSLYFKVESPVDLFKFALLRARRSILVFFCMTFIVQQLRVTGSLAELSSNLPSFLLGAGVPVLGAFGSALIGTSTVASLFFSPVVDPIHFAALSAGSSIGVQLAFQSLAGMRSILKDQITEKRIITFIAPISVAFVLILTLFAHYYEQ